MERAYITWRSCLAAILLCSGSCERCQANNLSITQPMLVDFNSGGGTVDVRFTISWQNSWRLSTAPANWDAAPVLR